MFEKRKPIHVEDAVANVMHYAKRNETETIAIEDCDNRRLAKPVNATNPVPPFAKSPYDGFAIRSADTKQGSRKNPITFEVVEHIGAGQVPVKALQKNQATRIMTGAQIPDGADCVAMFEVCETYKDAGVDYMMIKRTMETGTNIVAQGSEVETGDALIDAGTLINPGVKAVLATFGYDRVSVRKKPVVGVIATGSELLDVDEALQPGKIRNSNAHMILSQLKRIGADYRYFGKLTDDFESSYKTIRDAFEEVDVLITTGGVSVGDFDFLPEVYKKLEAEVLFNKIAMRPGSVTTAAVKNDKLLFGLSGNPSACYVGFELFVRPVIMFGLGQQKPFLKRVKAILQADFPKPNPFTRFVRGRLTYESGTLGVELVGIDKSNVVTSLAHTNVFIVFPGGTRGFTYGQQVDALLLEDNDGQADF